jgi:hypothetical protein
MLRGLGTALALPALEAMGPMKAFAGDGEPARPLRTAFLFVPNGVNTANWFPATEGDKFEFPFTLQPLEPFRKDLLVLSGLTHDKARPNGDGPGDHARSAAAFLTGSQPKKTDGREIKCGVSIDQLAAEKLGGRTRLPSLELGCDRGAMAGNCDSGYSCAYSSTISWKSPTQPLPKEINPRSVFSRMFGDPGAALAARDRARQDMYRKSVLDLVLEDARALGASVGTADQRKLDEYLDSVRQIERQIQATERENEKKLPKDVVVPEGMPGDYPTHIRLMMDLIVLAFQTDMTRIATFMLANEGSNRAFRFIDVPEGHHSLSHHQRNSEKLEKIKKIDRFYVEQFAYFLDKMSRVKEGDKTLLDGSQVVYGSAIGDGDRHNHDELPVVFAGRAGGTVSPGRHVRYPRNTPMANLFLEMLDRMGVKEERFGDSTGRLPGLTV